MIPLIVTPEMQSRPRPRPPHDETWYSTYQPNTGNRQEVSLPPTFDYTNNGRVFLQDGTIF